jgi:hypothetical protein
MAFMSGISDGAAFMRQSKAFSDVTLLARHGYSALMVRVAAGGLDDIEKQRIARRFASLALAGRAL